MNGACTDYSFKVGPWSLKEVKAQGMLCVSFYRENDSVDDAVHFGFDPRTRKSIRRLTQARTAVHEIPSYYF